MKKYLRRILLLGMALLSYISISAKENIDDCSMMRTVPYLQSPTQNSIIVRWVTKLDCHGLVEYGTDSIKVINGTGRKLTTNQPDVKTLTHRIKLTGLTPGQKYYYRVKSIFPDCNGQSGHSEYSKFYSFTAFDDSRDNFTMLIFNDLHPNLYDSQWLDSFISLLSNTISGMKYDLVVFNGDCFDDFKKEEDIIFWLNKFSEFTNSFRVPAIYIAGNHEYRLAPASTYLPKPPCSDMLLEKYIEFVDNGSSYGTIRLGDSQLLFLDTGENLYEANNFWAPDLENYIDCFYDYYCKQKQFINDLKQDEKFMNATKKILIHHIPFFEMSYKKEGQPDFYNPYFYIGGDILNSYLIDVSINGHTHAEYIINKNKYNTSIGKYHYHNAYPVYVASGPNKLDVEDNHLEMIVLSKDKEKLLLTTHILTACKKTIKETKYKIEEGELITK